MQGPAPLVVNKLQKKSFRGNPPFCGSKMYVYDKDMCPTFVVMIWSAEIEINLPYIRGICQWPDSNFYFCGHAIFVTIHQYEP